MQELRGVLPVFQTPYHDDESIDVATLEREIDWLFACGADGVVMAMVSEVLRLSTNERQMLAEMACAFARGRVIISVGAESARVACDLAKHAETSGAAAVMAIPPVSIVIGEDELAKYYRRVIEAVSIPVIVQDASGYVGRPMSIAMQAKLFNDFGERVMFKPEAAPIGPRLTELLDATAGRAKVFEGTGGIALVDSFRRGIVGTMPGADLIEAIVALWRALRENDSAVVARIDAPLQALVGMQTSLDAFLAVEKYLLKKQGIFVNTLVRGPVGFVMDDAMRRKVDELFEGLQIAVHG
jgi:dihydrodipicolinate synthase/N-acetylneuraminate lyase